jgi:hypothetical protein
VGFRSNSHSLVFETYAAMSSRSPIDQSDGPRITSETPRPSGCEELGPTVRSSRRRARDAATSADISIIFLPSVWRGQYLEPHGATCSGPESSRSARSPRRAPRARTRAGGLPDRTTRRPRARRSRPQSPRASYDILVAIFRGVRDLLDQPARRFSDMVLSTARRASPVAALAVRALDGCLAKSPLVRSSAASSHRSRNQELPGTSVPGSWHRDAR